ncbi:hypothetical protein L1077_22105 [Pseudoalteromonas luteoviolacea]|uniref:hypothetical protein n=1 Tax=Pseudoalteromonas luteoviolacea TaxID=43657 RepID=UPI001F23CD3A|nr:hypothetical protein [Pseudoalteromonas luteoviolacea]MCF6442124.1 hypothetical protein [Pseudoalteromonas luteoviolacea]
MISRLVLIFLAVILTGCTATYQPLKAKYGYVVIPKNGTYYIEYHGTDKVFVEESWVKAAEETCPDGFKTLSKWDETIHGSFKSPVAGQMVSLGTRDFLLLGRIKCNSPMKPNTELTNSAWTHLHQSQNDYVSSAYVAQKINMTHRQVRFMATASVAEAIDYFDWKFEEVLKSSVNGELTSKVWLKRDGALPIGFVMTYKGDCPVEMKVVPPMAMVLLGFNTSKVSNSILSATHGVFKVKPNCIKLGK